MDPLVTPTNTTPVNADDSAPLGAPPPAAAPPAANPAPDAYPPASYAAPNSGESRVVTVPTHAMKKIKDEEREKGRREALSELAKHAGFDNELSLVQALSGLRNQTQQPNQPPSQQQTQPPAQQQQPPAMDPLAERNNQRAAAKYERDLERLTRDRDTYVQKYNVAHTELKRLREQLDAKEAEMSLREIAVSAGVTDVDYALRLFYREVENKSEEELAKMDERSYFASLRTSKPYLFGEVSRPATTGTGTGNAPTAPKPGQVNSQAANTGKFDARQAKPQDIQDRLRKMGLNPGL